MLALHDDNIYPAVQHWIMDPVEATNTYGPISKWNVEEVTDMTGLFRYAKYFNEDISQWNTSSVTSMREIFYRAESFDSDISGWDTSNVSDLKFAFGGALSFRGDLWTWNTSRVTTMKGIFYEAELFDGDIASWDVSVVTDFSFAFTYAYAFTGQASLSAWNVSSATSMESMFHFASSYVEEVCWDVRESAKLDNMFCDCKARLNNDCVDEALVQKAERCSLKSRIGDSSGGLLPINSTRNTNALIFLGWMSLLLATVLLYTICAKWVLCRRRGHDSQGLKDLPPARSSDGNLLAVLTDYSNDHSCAYLDDYSNDTRDKFYTVALEDAAENRALSSRAQFY